MLACAALFCNLCPCAAVCACAQATDAANAAYLPKKAELCKAAGVTEADVLLFEPDTNTTRPAYAVWVDEKNRRVVWGFRGTTDLNVSRSSSAGSIGACAFACAAAQAGRQPPLQQRGQQRQTASSHCSATGRIQAYAAEAAATAAVLAVQRLRLLHAAPTAASMLGAWRPAQFTSS